MWKLTKLYAYRVSLGGYIQIRIHTHITGYLLKVKHSGEAQYGNL